MSRLINPVPQYLDNKGDPLVNGKLYFYKAGTNTPIITYADSKQTIPNTNPVLLNEAADVPNVFYEGSAKVVLTHDILETGQVGIQRWERDPVGGENELGNFALYDSAFSYDINSIVEGSDGEFYVSLADGNQANDPTLTPSKWKLWPVNAIWNPTIPYSTRDIAQTTAGNLYKAKTGNTNTNPETDDGTIWGPAVNSESILTPTNTAEVLIGGGSVTALLLNEIQDGSSYTVPLANSVNEDQYIIISQALEFVSFQPELNTSPGDLFINATGTDTNILFDNSRSIDIRLTSDGVSRWRLTV